MKIGIISDSHDNVWALRKAIEFLNEKCDLVIHCGDLCSPFSAKELLKLKKPLYFVFGNNDAEKCKIKEILGCKVDYNLELNLCGKKILVTHGDDALLIKNSIGKYDIIIHGHTHKKRAEKINGTLIINPGELCGCLTDKKTLAILDLKSDRVEFFEI